MPDYPNGEGPISEEEARAAVASWDTPEFRSAQPFGERFEVTLPWQTTFAEGADVADAIAFDFDEVIARRWGAPIATGGTGIEVGISDLVLAVTVAVGGVYPFVHRFMEHLADDTYAEFRRRLVAFVKKRKRQRAGGPKMRVFLMVDDPKGRQAQLSWDADDEADIRRLSEAATKLQARSFRRRATLLWWDRKARKWVLYEWLPGEGGAVARKDQP